MAPCRPIRVFHGSGGRSPAAPVPCGVLVSDLIFVFATVAAFAVLGLLVRGVERL